MSGTGRVRLTDSAIARLRPREREYTVWNTSTPGLGVRMRPSRGTIFVLLRKTVGRSTRLSLGSATSMRVDDARHQCHALMSKPDTKHPTKRTCKVPLFRDFVVKPWKESHFSRYKQSTLIGVNTILIRQLLPAFGATPLDPITRNHLLHWFDASSQTAPVGTNHALRILRQILKFAIAGRHFSTNPARDVPMNRSTALTRFLSGDELRRMHRALDRNPRNSSATHTEGRHHPVTAVDRASQGEVLTLRWNRGGRRHHRPWRH